MALQRVQLAGVQGRVHDGVCLCVQIWRCVVQILKMHTLVVCRGYEVPINNVLFASLVLPSESQPMNVVRQRSKKIEGTAHHSGPVRRLDVLVGGLRAYGFQPKLGPTQV